MSTEIPVESKGKSKETLYQYRTIITTQEDLNYYIYKYNCGDYPQLFVGFHYRKIETNVFDCRFSLNIPVESIKDRTRLVDFISECIKLNSWKNSNKIYAYQVYLENHYVEKIEAVEREGLLPFMIEPSPELGEKAYTLYSYYDDEHIAGALATDLANPRPPAPLEPLPELAMKLAMQLDPSQQLKFTVSRLLALEPKQAAKTLLSRSPLMRQKIVGHLEEMREKKDSAKKAELIMLHAAELEAITPRAEALHLLNLESEEAVDLCQKAKLKGDSKVVKALQETEHGDKAKVILEELMKSEALSLLEQVSPTKAAEILHQYERSTRLKYISYLGQLREDTPSLNEKIEAIFQAMLVKDRLGAAPLPPAVQSNGLSLEWKIFIGFIGISFVRVGVACGLYAALEKAEKIDASREFFSNNYEMMLGGLGGVVGLVGLVLLMYWTTCRPSNDVHRPVSAPEDEYLFSSPFAPYFMGVV